MSEIYLWLKWAHVVSSTVLFGMGAGIARCCWLPVVWLQVRMRKLAARAMLDGTALPAVYSRYYRWWFYLGWPAFTGVLFVFYLMVVKPAI